MKIGIIATTEGAGSTFVATNLAYTVNGAYLDLSRRVIGHTFFEESEITFCDLVIVQKTLNGVCKDCVNCLSLCHKKKFFKGEEGNSLYCEGCPVGDCEISCEKDLLEENERKIGALKIFKSGKNTVAYPSEICKEASLKQVGESALKILEKESVTVIDCPSADDAYALDIIKLCDYCVIAVEPGAFDFENFKSLVRLIKLAGKPYGVVINKIITEYGKLNDYCNLHSTEVLAKIPYSKREAKLIESGKLIAKEKFLYKQYFTNAFAAIKKKLK